MRLTLPYVFILICSALLSCSKSDSEQKIFSERDRSKSVFSVSECLNQLVRSVEYEKIVSTGMDRVPPEQTCFTLEIDERVSDYGVGVQPYMFQLADSVYSSQVCRFVNRIEYNKEGQILPVVDLEAISTQCQESSKKQVTLKLFRPVEKYNIIFQTVEVLSKQELLNRFNLVIQDGKVIFI